MVMGRASHVWGGHSGPPHLTFLGGYLETVQEDVFDLRLRTPLPISETRSKAADEGVRPTRKRLLDQRASVCWLFFWGDHYRCGYAIPCFYVQQADALG